MAPLPSLTIRSDVDLSAALDCLRELVVFASEQRRLGQTSGWDVALNLLYGGEHEVRAEIARRSGKPMPP